MQCNPISFWDFYFYFDSSSVSSVAHTERQKSGNSHEITHAAHIFLGVRSGPAIHVQTLRSCVDIGGGMW